MVMGKSEGGDGDAGNVTVDVGGVDRKGDGDGEAGNDAAGEGGVDGDGEGDERLEAAG